MELNEKLDRTDRKGGNKQIRKKREVNEGQDKRRII